MLWIYLKLIARNLWKNKLFASINVLGIVNLFDGKDITEEMKQNMEMLNEDLLVL
jgi:hypothetical protein